MKLKTATTIFFLAIMFSASAQWTQISSPSKSKLNDIVFYNNKYGFAVGEDGTVIRSKDGGQTWELATVPEKTNLASVTVIDSLTIFVTTSSYPNASVYRSVNGGKSWKKVLDDTRTLYTAASADKSVYAVSNYIYKTTDGGQNWAQQSQVNSTSTYKHISFANDRNGIAAGNISGIVTYSADFQRTTDGGAHWYTSDPFSFPNANGFSALSAIATDTIFMFTNFYRGFSEGDSCQLITLTKFKLQSFLGTKQWKFKSNIVAEKFYDKVYDCKFFSGGAAYAAGAKGIYASANSGKQWITEYSSGKLSVNALYMQSPQKGFAVGDGGLILMRTPQPPAHKKIAHPPVATQVQ